MYFVLRRNLTKKEK